MAGLGSAGGAGLFTGQSLAVLGAGLLAGAIVGAGLVASGTVDFSGAANGGSAGGAAGGATGAGLEVVPCPNQGPVIGTIPRNQQVLVTARSADGGWLQVLLAGARHRVRVDEGRAAAARRRPELAADRGLRGAAHPDPAAHGRADGDARPRPPRHRRRQRPPRPPARPRPRRPTATAHPDRAADAEPDPDAERRAQALGGQGLHHDHHRFDQGSYCPDARKTVTFSVTASDSDGIASVTLAWRKPGATTFSQRPMTLSGGRYVATLDTNGGRDHEAGKLRLLRRRPATPNATPKTTRSPASGSLVHRRQGLRQHRSHVHAPGRDTRLDHRRPAQRRLQRLDALRAPGPGHRRRRRAEHPSCTSGSPATTAYTARDFSRDGDTWYSFINTGPLGRRHPRRGIDQLVRRRHRHQGQGDEVGGRHDLRHPLRQPGGLRLRRRHRARLQRPVLLPEHASRSRSTPRTRTTPPPATRTAAGCRWS